MNKETIYEGIAVLAKHLREENRVMTFSRLAAKLSSFFDEQISGGRAMATQVAAAYRHFDGDGDMQENIAKAFVNEQGEYAYY